MQTRAKQERIIELVRQGLEGDAAVEFVQHSGHAITSRGIVQHLRHMGGRGRILRFIEEGKTNIEILQICFPDTDLAALHLPPPTQSDLFGDEAPPAAAHRPDEDAPLYDTSKLTLRLPSDLYEAIRVAAKAENKTHNELITDILTAALARMPAPPSG